MRKPALLLLLSFLHLIIYAQTPGIALMKRHGGSQEDRYGGITRLNNGNYICAGYTYSTNGQGVGNHGNSDFMINCITEKGQLLWSKVLGGSINEGFATAGNTEAVSPTADGGFFFGGAVSSSDGDVPLLKGSYDAFIARFDKDGNILWKKTYGSSQTEFLSAVAATPDGGCIFSASSGGSSDGDVPAGHGTGKTDVWIVKLGATGNIEWSRLYGGSAIETATDIITTADGNYVFTADAQSSDGDLTGIAPTGVNRATDLWIVKINATGGIVWQKDIGGSDDDDGARIIQASSGDYYVTAASRSADRDFISNTGLYDIVLIKLTNTGTTTYIKNFGGLAWDTGVDLTEAADGNIVIAALSYSTQIGGFAVPSRGGSDIVLVKADKSSGVPVWAVSMGGSQGDFPRAIMPSADGGLIIAGQTASTDGDFSAGALGGDDAIFIKMAAFNAIKGAVFYDYNGNGTKESNEPYVQNIKVTSVKRDAYSVTGYSDNGNYFNEVDTGTFVTKPRLFNDSYYTVVPDSFTTTFPTYYGSVVRNFGIKPIPGKRDLRSVLVGVNPARAGRASYYRLICYNAGTDTVTSGAVTFIKDARTSFVSSLPVQSAVTGDTITWQYSNFKPLDTLVFDITLNVATSVVFNDRLAYRSQIGPLAGDLQPGNNIYLLYHMVIGSFDPNDKNEAHADLYSSTDLNNKEWLTYTVRFQNTGTDTAFNIEVKDTLETKLDPSSLELLATSHKAKFTLVNNIATWKFDNILLPDSNINEKASHGFILYRVKPSSAVRINDTIRNSASIYFDYNAPVKTNTYLTIIRLPVPPQPLTSTVNPNYCSSVPSFKVKVMNIPSAEYQASVVVKLDNTQVTVATDSTVNITPSTLSAGQHSLLITFGNTTTQVTTSHNFTITSSVTPDVSVSSNIDLVTNLQDPVVLTARPELGGGKTPVYAFSKERNFTTLLQAESVQATISIRPESLTVGSNWLYVRMKSSDTCALTGTAVDSIQINRSPVTGIQDPSRPGVVITAMPNPFRQSLLLTGLNPATATTIRIYSGEGQLVYHVVSKGTSSKTIRLQVSGGIYYMSLSNEKGHVLGAMKVVAE